MKQERVIAILDFYRDIDKTVTMNERVIRNLEDQYYSTLGAVNSDGMPHGKGGVSNPVERVVLNIPQSVSDTIANMRRENEKLTAIKGEILSELNALNYREKAVIYGFYIDGLQWERLSQRVNYSPRQCRNIRNIALERFGWTSVAYRVKAYDSAGAESAYNTSATRTVVNNHAPVISGTDSNLGTKTAAFTQSYSVTDKDSGQTLTVTEYIDGTQKRSYTATSGQTYSFNITAAEWVKLLNGSHTLKIVAADNYGGSATRTYTFTKNETEIELTLATPLTADDMVTKGIMSVVRQIPAGAKFTVEVCNNGNDASPTWEDVTQNVVSGSKFFLSNTTKTASAWGYNFRIKVKRGTATGDCFITSAGGNFE